MQYRVHVYSWKEALPRASATSIPTAILRANTFEKLKLSCREIEWKVVDESFEKVFPFAQLLIV